MSCFETRSSQFGILDSAFIRTSTTDTNSNSSLADNLNCVLRWSKYPDSRVVLRNCVPLGVGNFKLVFEGNLLLQCKYFYFLSLYVDVSDNKNSNDCQSCVLCTLNRTDVAK